MGVVAGQVEIPLNGVALLPVGGHGDGPALKAHGRNAVSGGRGHAVVVQNGRYLTVGEAEQGRVVGGGRVLLSGHATSLV